MRLKLITLIIVMVAFVTAIIAQQYERVVKIYRDGEVLNSYIVSEIDSIKFYKQLVYSVAVEASPQIGGSATINGEGDKHLLKEGDSVILHAVASPGYVFVGWTKDDLTLSKENPYTTTAEGAATYVANFQKGVEYCYPTGNMQHSVRYFPSFTLTDGVSYLEVKDIQKAPKDEAYKDRTSSVFVTEAGSALHFSELNWQGEWMHGYVYIDYNCDGEFNTIANPLALNNGELVSYNYLSEKGASQGTNSKGEVTSNNCDVTAQNMPAWVLPSDLAPGEYRLRVKIDWNDSNPCGSTRENNEIQINGGCICDITLRIISSGPAPIATYKVTPEESGTVEITDESGRDGKVLLYAIPNQGYVFDSWNVAGVQQSKANPYEAIILEDTEYEAIFRTPQVVTVTATSTKGGTAEVSETNPLEGTEVELTATPEEGYVFKNWMLNGEKVSVENPYVVTVTGNANYIATFVKPLPKVYVNTPNGVAITSKEVWTEDCEIVIVDSDGNTSISSTTSFRGRGNSTWAYPKKPYAIKLDSKSEVLGMPKHKRWVLLANWMDRTLLRNAVSFEMARQIMDWAPRGEFVEFYLNGEHQGNYYLCEQIKIDKNRINISEFEDDATDGEDGGYLLEFDTNYQAEINYFMSKYYNYPVTIKDPDEEIITSWQHPLYTYIYNYIGETESALKNNNFETLFSKIDYSTFIDYLLIQEVSGNGECNHPKSSYMYKDAGGKICAGPVWDFDWGTYSVGAKGFINNQAIWYKELFKSSEFKTALKARWAEVKHVFENIDSFIDEQSDLIRESEAINHEMWPIDNRHNYPNGDELIDFDSAVERMKQAIEERIIELDAAISSF